MASPKGLGDLAVSAGSEALAFGLGFALARVLEPYGTELAYAQWAQSPIRAPEALVMAEGVAQGQVDPGKAAEWAQKHGYSAEAFAALVNVANVGPSLGYAYQAWRRHLLTDAEFGEALKRTGLEEQWNAAMRGLHDELLDAGAIATAVHRGIVAGGGLLLREPPAGDGAIPHVPQSNLDAVAEFAGHGITEERARILVGNTGLPLALGEMLRLLNLGEVEEDDVRRSVAQSNVRNEYMDAALALRRRLLTPHEYAEAQLRGLRTPAEREQGAGFSGMEPGDSELLFELLGRPLNVRQITTGLARGGHFGGDYEGVPEPYLDALRRSAVRPEYGNLAYANRFTLPSAFVLRALVQAGEVSPARGEQVLLYQGWEPTFAHEVASAWAGSSTGAGKTETKAELDDEFQGGFITEQEYRAALTTLGYIGHAQDLLVHLGDARREKRYREKAIDAIAAAYTSFKLDDARAVAELGELSVSGAARDLLLTVWRKQRLDTISLLTPAQVKKAYGANLITRAQALQELEWRHYSATDAAELLDE